MNPASEALISPLNAHQQPQAFNAIEGKARLTGKAENAEMRKKKKSMAINKNLVKSGSVAVQNFSQSGGGFGTLARTRVDLAATVKNVQESSSSKRDFGIKKRAELLPDY